MGLLLRPAAADPAVSVVELPQGEREVVGSAGFEGHTLRLSAQGAVLSWTDAWGNTPLAGAGNGLPALDVLDSAPGERRLWPLEKGPAPEFRAVSPLRTDAACTGDAGLRVVCQVEPDRVGIRVEGPAKTYVVQGRSPCRAEGCRIVTAGNTVFPSAGPAKLDAPRQLLLDARRTRALALSPPDGTSVAWRLVQTDGWAWTREHVSWRVALRPGETLWLASAETPRHEGPVEIGLHRRRGFRPEGEALALATLSTARLASGAGTSLRLSKTPAQLVPDGVLVAALLPMQPDDPVEQSEQGAWFTRFDLYGPRMLPVELREEQGAWNLRAPRDVGPGAYRLRLWVVPKDAPRPECLGGPKGAAVGYFPGFEGRGNAIVQPHPTGDVLVVVGDKGQGSLSVGSPALRKSFWRGEQVLFSLRVRTPQDQVQAHVRVCHIQSRAQVADFPAVVRLHGGEGMVEVGLPSANLAPGDYEVRATCDGLVSYPYTFTIAGPLPSAMPLINSPLAPPNNLDACARLGITAWADVMPSTAGFAPAWPLSPPANRGLAVGELMLPRSPQPAPGEYDRLAGLGALFLQGIQSRQISFALHHTIAEHEAETLRKHLVYAQFGRRFPSALGLVLDYDLAGVGEGLGFVESYVKGMQRKKALMDQRWEAAWAEAKKRGATEADKPRLRNQFCAGVIEGLYARSMGNLLAAVPEQRHTSAVTADHAYIQDGQYLPAIYRPLGFRYLEVWNDQIYPNSAHDMQESFWTSLLRMEKSAGVPVWLTVPTAPQPATHLRRSLEAIARGATGIGYGAEGAAGLAGGWGADPLRSDVRTAQEILSGDLARQYGTWLNAFEPAEEIGILYSQSQGGTNFGQSSPVFFAYYTLAQINRPARLLTEDEIARGSLRPLKALVVVRQTAALPSATLEAIEAFAAGGGKVICDRDTKLAIRGAVRLDEVSWPGGLWPTGGNAFHKVLRDFVEKMGPPLRSALGSAGQQPLESRDGAALVATKTAGGALLAIVTNNRFFPFEELLGPEQRVTAFYRKFLVRGGTYFKDVCLPQRVNLALRADLAAAPLHVYDVFAGRELPIQKTAEGAAVSVDLTALSGRALLLTRQPVVAPQVSIGQRQDADALATLVVKNPVPLPVRIRVGTQEVWRAATPAGSCDRFALGPQPGDVAVEVTELVTGKTQRATLKLSKPIHVQPDVLPGVQVWDAERVRRVLKSPSLAVYVDPLQAGEQAAARELASALGAEVVFNPPIADYPLLWNPSAAQEQANARTVREKLLAWRRLPPSEQQWTGAVRPAAVWNRPVVLLGHAQNNRLIADLDSGTLLARPAGVDALDAGYAFIQPVAAPFWNGQDAVVVLCRDPQALRAACERLKSIARGGDGDSRSLASDGGARAERRCLLGWETPEYPSELVPLQTETRASSVGLAPVLPLSGLAAVEGGVLATLHSPGLNLVRLDAQGRVAWRVSTAGFYQPTKLLANAQGECVTDDGTFVWRHRPDGSVSWKALGQAVRAPESDGSTWLTADGRLHRLSAAGQPLGSVALDGSLAAIYPDGRTAIVQRSGEKGKGREKADAALAAVRLPENTALWSVPNLLAAEVRMSADGSTVACIEHENMAGRDDLDRDDASRLTVLDAQTGRVLLRRPMGPALADLHVSADGKRVVAAERGFNSACYVADVPASVVRRFVLPEPGAWAKFMSRDGRQLWVACERLYRVDLDQLAATRVLDRRTVQLSLGPGGDLAAGTSDGKVLWLDGQGRIEREVDLTQGIAAQPDAQLLAALREAPLALGPALRPHEVPAVIPLTAEYELDFMIAGDVISVRGDGIQAPRVAIRIPAKGKYRFTVELTNKEEAAKIGRFFIYPEGSGERGPMTAPLAGNPLRQTVERDFGPGVQSFTLLPTGWQTGPLLRTLSVERAAGGDAR
jgi:hypothetical protein